MKVIITADEALNLGIWDNLCKIKGLNVWAIKEGLMDSDEEIVLNKEEATKLGLWPKP